MDEFVMASQEAVSITPAASGGASSGAAGSSTTTPLLPRKRRAADSVGLADTTDSILSVCGPQKEVPKTLTQKNTTLEWISKNELPLKTVSSAWGFLEIYQRPGATDKDLHVLCQVCWRMGKTSLLLLAQANVSNGMKHFRLQARHDLPSLSQLSHACAALYVSKNVKGGNRAARDAYSSRSIDHFLVSKKDRRAFHVEFVLMQVMSLSPHALTTNAYMRSFLSNHAGYVPPALNTVVHHLAELYQFVVSALLEMLESVKKRYVGLPFAHMVTDLWTESYRKKSFGSVVVRLVDPASGTMVESHLGVHLFIGRHTSDNITRWLLRILSIFGLREQDIASTTLDSGANVRKALRTLSAPWLPCISHSLHNAVMYALGKTSASDQRNADGAEDRDLPAAERPNHSLNPSAKQLLTKTRKLLNHFQHSELTVSIYNNVSTPGLEEARELVGDVPTRWTSTYNAMARLYTVYPRLCALFMSPNLGVKARRKNLDVNERDRLRQVIGVLRPCHEMVTRSESATEPVSTMLALLSTLRRVMNADRFCVPRGPGSALAVGGASIEKYCEDHEDDLNLELENHLYLAEYLQTAGAVGRGMLCDDAYKSVRVLRQQLGKRIFDKTEPSRNLLQSGAAIMSSVVTPGGVHVLAKLASAIEFPSPVPRAISLLKGRCGMLASPSHPGGPAASCPAADGRA